MKTLEQLHRKIEKFGDYLIEKTNISLDNFDVCSDQVDDGEIEFAFYITGKDNLKISVHEEKILFQYSKFNQQHPSIELIEKEFDKFFKGFPIRK